MVSVLRGYSPFCNFKARSINYPAVRDHGTVHNTFPQAPGALEHLDQYILFGGFYNLTVTFPVAMITDQNPISEGNLGCIFHNQQPALGV